SHTENRAVLCVAAQGGAAVEEPPGGDQRPARPCTIRSTERVENPQSGTGISAVTSGAAGEGECQRHTHRSESEEFRVSVAEQREPRHVVTPSALNGLGARTVNGKNGGKAGQVEHLPNVILQAT